MRVLFIYKFLTTGGVETVLRARMDALKELGVDCDIWFLEAVDGHAVFRGVEAELYFGDQSKLSSHLRKRSYDTISVIDTPEVLLLLQQLIYSPRILIEAHTPYLENLEYVRQLESKDASLIVVPSDHQFQLVQKRLNSPIPMMMLPNPLSTKFVSEPTNFRPIPPRPIVGWVGRLDGLKNWRLAIKTTSVLRKREWDVELWIAGRLTERATANQLYRAAQSAGILDRLKWFENLPHHRMHLWLDAVRLSGGVVLATSKGESFGMSVAEAMARRCPVVVPDASPFVEFISHDREGKLYEHNSPRRAATQIEGFLLDQDLRSSCGFRARERILADHHPKQANSRWVDTVTDLQLIPAGPSLFSFRP
ncbi:MAG: glycosyltransferase family 4 protein [Anaerolineales bacterium]